jgi:histidine triad (HIT) family protein
MAESCIFCDIAEGRAPGYIVAENDLAFALLDIHPLAKGHCLVLPRRHVPWWDDLTEDETDAVFRLARLTARAMRKTFTPDLVTMYVRGRRVPHAHVFLVPTFADDPLDRHFNALEGFQEHAPELAAAREPEAMRQAFEELRAASH